MRQRETPRPESPASTGSSLADHRLHPPVKLRLAGFTVVVLCGVALLAWIAHTTWEQLDRLQKEHAAVSTESFYLAVSLRGSIRGLNEKLMQFGSSPDPGTRSQFLHDSTELRQWLAINRQHLAELAKLPLLKQILIDDFQILDKIQSDYDRYLQDTADLLQPEKTPVNPLTFEARYKRIRRASAPLLGSCDDLVQAQREDFTDFLAETQATLLSHEHLLQLNLFLIVTLALALTALVYRGMIAPLRIGLSESKSIIARQEKLASLGVLASGVAHEIRNPLTAIKFRLFSLKRSLPALTGNEDATIIADEINRLERIVKDFLQFARPSDPALAPVQANQLLKAVSDLLKAQLQRASVQLQLEFGPVLWVTADAGQIKQVLINLIQNALDASGRNGTITLSARRSEVEWGGRTHSAAILAVADTGKGIPEEVRLRLFDPFFTTKEGGTGLGLAIAARIVEKHGGVLRYQTVAGRGTVFELVLPEITAPPPADASLEYASAK